MKNELTFFNDRSFMEPMGRLHRQIDRLFDDMLSPVSGSLPESAAITALPAADVEETDSHYVISMDVPGVSKDDIRVELHGSQLQISAERKERRKEKGAGYRFTERNYGRWERSFTLPESVDADKIEAHYDNGVLTLAVPKTETAKPRQIKIQDKKPDVGAKGGQAA